MGIRPEKERGLGPQFIARPDAAKSLAVYKWPDRHVRMLSVVTVQPDEWLFFVKGGRIVGYLTSGEHVLDGEGVPFLQHIVDEASGGRVLIAEAYFVSSREFANQAFAGSMGEVRDPATDVMVKLGVVGTYAYKVVDPGKLIVDLIGTRGVLGNEEIAGVISDHLLIELRALVNANIVERGWEVLRLTSGVYNPALAAAAVSGGTARIDDYGLVIARIQDFNVSVDPADRAKLSEIYDRRAKTKLAADPHYQAMAEAEAVLGAAEGLKKGGGGGGGLGSATDFAGIGIGLGIGMKVAERFARGPGGNGKHPEVGVTCPVCGTTVSPGRYCSACGADLAATSAGASAQPEPGGEG